MERASTERQRFPDSFTSDLVVESSETNRQFSARKIHRSKNRKKKDCNEEIELVVARKPCQRRERRPCLFVGVKVRKTCSRCNGSAASVIDLAAAAASMARPTGHAGSRPRASARRFVVARAAIDGVRRLAIDAIADRDAH